MRNGMDYRDEIQFIAEQRNIQYLLHFTQFANLSGIVAHGISSRSELIPMAHTGYVSDSYRRDENDDAISVSITNLNQKMFRKKQELNGRTQWIVIALAPEILWSKRCNFCWHNAATKEMKRHQGFRGGPWALSKLFDGSAEERDGLEPNEPTDRQSEVQVFDRIEPEYILAAVVGKESLVGPVSKILRVLPGRDREVIVQDLNTI